MKYVEDYWIKKYESGIVHLCVNTKERGVYYHQFCDHLYSIGGDLDIDTSTPEGLEEYKSTLLEIPLEELVLEQEIMYVSTSTQEKDQISFYFIPFSLVTEKVKTKSPMEIMNEYLDSPQCAIDMQEFKSKREAKEKKILKYKKRYDAMTDAEFKAHVIKEDAKHDATYRHNCYTSGSQPYPMKELQNIHDVMLNHGKEYTPRKWEMFASEYRRYKGLTIIVFNGQGTIIEIKSGKKSLSHI